MAPLAHLTTGVELLTIAFRGLADDEQAEALSRLAEIRATAEAGEESETAQMISSLRRVVEHLGHAPAPDDYKRARDELAIEGLDLIPLSRLIRHFGSWRLAKEALALSEVTTTRRIDARFRSRRLGKIWRYTDATLEETLRRAVEEIGHVPRVAEFEFWRERQVQLAAAEGNDAFHLPSANPYRKRWGTWQAALCHFGFAPEAIAERLERQ